MLQTVPVGQDERSCEELDDPAIGRRKGKLTRGHGILALLAGSVWLSEAGLPRALQTMGRSRAVAALAAVCL